MGINDRDYMRQEPRTPGSIPKRKPNYSESNLTFWQRFRFAIWSFFKRRQ
jgi:hypothetical protein